jgi:ribonuclease-3
MKDIKPLEKKLGLVFNNPDLLLQAVVHRSYLNEHSEYELAHNERLEFLGDAVLELCITEYLYLTFENPEGELTNWRASLVNAIMLARVANEIGIEEFLHLSKGEEKDANTKARQYILANALEAIIGAIYLDSGYVAAQKFANERILIHLPEIFEKRLYRDPKSHFQELSQEREGVTPTYKVLEESGPDHAKMFKVGLYLGRKKIAEGVGSSKQEAQVDAAANGLEVQGWK